VWYRGGYRSGLWRTTPVSAVRAGDWKLMEFFEDGRLELYHLKEDIGEQVNLAEERPEKRDALYRLLKAWRRAVKAPVPTQLNPHYNPEKIKLDLQALKKRNETIQTR